MPLTTRIRSDYGAALKRASLERQLAGQVPNTLQDILEECQCGIPYKNPGDGVLEWDRKQGNASLRIEAGSAIDPRTGDFVRLGLPYGEKPRLVLIHLATEAVRTGSPVVDVEESMTAFARSLGLETNGQQLRALKDLRELSTALTQCSQIHALNRDQLLSVALTAILALPEPVKTAETGGPPVEPALPTPQVVVVATPEQGGG